MAKTMKFAGFWAWTQASGKISIVYVTPIAQAEMWVQRPTLGESHGIVWEMWDDETPVTKRREAIKAFVRTNIEDGTFTRIHTDMRGYEPIMYPGEMTLPYHGMSPAHAWELSAEAEAAGWTVSVGARQYRIVGEAAMRLRSWLLYSEASMMGIDPTNTECDDMDVETLAGSAQADNVPATLYDEWRGDGFGAADAPRNPYLIDDGPEHVACEEEPAPKPQAEHTEPKPATVEPPANTQVIPEVPPKPTDTARVVKVSESVIPAMVKFRELPGMADVTRRDVRKIRDSHGRKVGYVVRAGKAVRILWREWYRHDDASLDATVRAMAESWAKAA